MHRRPLQLSLVVLCLLLQGVQAQWTRLNNIEVKRETTELAGPRVVMSYDVAESDVRHASPIYLFVRYRSGPTGPWLKLSPDVLKGNGFGVVDTPGPKTVVWWGIEELGLKSFETAEFRVRGIRMCRIPGGRFSMKSIPGQGRDESESRQPTSELPGFLLARNETTIRMYADFLSETGSSGGGWNERMADPNRCGIERLDNGSYRVLPGRDDYPVTYVSWYDAASFARWCGLTLPTEAEFEKAIRGGFYLDGDAGRKVAHHSPERRYPWGDEEPHAGGLHRCNSDGGDDGFEFTAPVGSFSAFASPYGITDLVGNVAEWTQDWYSTSYHVGLDGFRVVRGGSWMDSEVACDAMSGATQLPLDESSIIGFRVAHSDTKE